ncbi:hypothetical protein B8V81_3806 [Paenibacillus pasadenensis]|uniref:Uncharacterized protein n=1 Tax=Paenibacillus pasadenensis TaxID=217090 RepID=A0A2N5N4V0_9BACL|nr:hypothetical protein B8V81_3806 [Paenibacillus pasadenensis]
MRGAALRRSGGKEARGKRSGKHGEHGCRPMKEPPRFFFIPA